GDPPFHPAAVFRREEDSHRPFGSARRGQYRRAVPPRGDRPEPLGIIVREVDRQTASNPLRAPGVCPPSILPRSMPAAFPAHSRAGNRSPTPSDDEPCQSFLHIGSTVVEKEQEWNTCPCCGGRMIICIS